MYSHCWLVLAGLFGLGLSQDGVDLCPVAIGTFASEHTGEIPPFCQAIQILLTNDVSHRLNLSDSDVNGICDTTNNRICYEALQDITIACATFPKKDINCLDSPAIINTGLCTSSDKTNNTFCYTSLSEQGVIESPDMLVPCLDAYINGDNCSSSCYTMLSKADCCFVSYYAFMIDVILDDGGQVFENVAVFSNDFWEWCGLSSPETCDDVKFMDVARRNSNFTCGQPPPTKENPPPDTPDCGTVNRPKMLYFITLFIFFVMLFI